MKNWTKVFSFTFRRQLEEKSYILTTLIVLLVIMTAGILAFVIIASNTEDDAALEIPQTTEIEKVYVAADDDFSGYDWNILNGFDEKYSRIEYIETDDIQNTINNAEGRSHALVVVIGRENGSVNMDILVPNGTELDSNEANDFGFFLRQTMGMLLLNMAELTPEQMSLLMEEPCDVEIKDRFEAEDDSENADELSQIKEVLGFIVPYVVIMFLYFLILFYGQGVAASVLLEKTSKLMDTFLVSIKPAAMIFGKILAIAASGLLQLGIWIAGGAASVILGNVLGKEIAPGHEFLVLSFLKQFSELHLFEPSAIVVSVLIVIAGFLMYCSLSSIGGSLAGKTEDLGTTNVIFSMALVISFLITLYSGIMGSGVNKILCFIPFTSILIVPGWLLLGKISVATAIAGLAIVIISMVLISYAAGRIYKLMSFYKGNPPSPKNILKMLKK